ncbi:MULTISPECIES: putative quinol monooxygenase [Actinomadura]|uniref:Quinol monooxygenase n=1 Tax=Actinomadura yumaensis TaxID=111807 RepID=A0ABW2CXT7_9ACTN|nr:putative quinol monooxygenase [Actinomadura sp. J1-007]MWK40550.1 antibiotic biosynthesis monooxygenase [Actinomadura sp. J1-007]
MTYVVMAEWTALDGEESAVAETLRVLTPLSRAEPGNLTYRAHVSDSDPRRFLIYEEYVDAAAFEAHRASPHFQEHVVGDCLARLASREITVYRPLAD